MQVRNVLITSLAVSGVLLLAGAGCASSTTNSNTTDTTNTTTKDTTTKNSNSANTNSADKNDNANKNTTVETNENTAVENTNDAVVENENTNESADTTEPSVKEFTVTASQFQFDPATITVNEGDTVKLNVTSSDVPHGFSIAAFGVSQTLSPNSSKTIEFVADKAGSYPIVCSVVCGTGHASMKGTLVVE